MKTQFAESYYRDLWDRFLDTGKEDPETYMNLEGELDRDTAPVIESLQKYPEDERARAITGVRKMHAQRIFSRRYADLKKHMRIVKKLEAGEQIRTSGDYIRRFEFNCLQLSDFMKKYNLNKI